MIEILPIDTPTLGDRSYLVHDGRVGFVVDPQRDIDRVLERADGLGVRIRHVFETHVHNDYVTGGLALARRTGADYHVGADDPVTFDRVPVRDGDVVDVSPRLSVRALATPGHTFTHLSYALLADGRPIAVFTGGSLLYGSSGRTDLLGSEHTHALAHAQYASAHRLAGELPDDVEVFPTHGFGSFCSATQTQGTASTIGNERRANPALTSDEERFVADMLAGLDAFPAYYAHMGAANLTAPADTPDLTPPARAEADELQRRIEAGEWVVDLRHRTAFAAGHLPRSLNFGLDGSFATYLGWLIPWGTPVTLLGETPEQVATAQRELVRIGIERPAAAATGDPRQWAGGQPLATLRRAGFADLAEAQRVTGNGGRQLLVLDVRRRQEWDAAHLAGAVHVPLHDLLHRMDEIPTGQQVWVHCQSGYRASLAASLLAASGRDVVHVDDDFTAAAGRGVALAAAV
jgi:hydroxyacylglutathione hydrolase